MFLLYRFLVGVAVWLALAPAELVAMALGRSSMPRLGQRLGRAGQRPGGQRPGRTIVHAVSAGEMVAAEALLAHWSRPLSSVILTTSTNDGLAVAEGIRGRRAEIEDVLLLPWDRPGAMRRWLRDLDPEIVVVVETEIWPGLFAACRELSLPLAVVNGRIYPRDLRRYRLLPRFFRTVLSAASWIGTQDETERRRFIDIGAPADRVEAVGQLKYDAIATDGFGQRGDVVTLAAALKGTGRLVVAASTHWPEEALLLDALADLRGSNAADLRLVLAPRDPRRARGLRRLTRARGFRPVLASELRKGSSVASWDVLILNRMGDLGAVLEHADIVVLGGTFAPVGGHNPIEAAARGQAIVTGPHTFHFAAVIEALARERAIWSLDSGRHLSSCLAGLLDDKERRDRLGQRARAVVEARRGTAALYARTLDELVSRSRANVSLDHSSRPSGSQSAVLRSKA